MFCLMECHGMQWMDRYCFRFFCVYPHSPLSQHCCCWAVVGGKCGLKAMGDGRWRDGGRLNFPYHFPSSSPELRVLYGRTIKLGFEPIWLSTAQAAAECGRWNAGCCPCRQACLPADWLMKPRVTRVEVGENWIFDQPKNHKTVIKYGEKKQKAILRPPLTRHEHCCQQQMHKVWHISY